MTMRFALLCIGLSSIGAIGASHAQDLPTLAESSFITRLADEAIDADGAEAVRSREYSRSVFANAFLGGYSNPESTIPVNPALSSSRMNGAGWSAGQAYRRAYPESVAQIMREYGYKEFEGAGAWTYGFEAGGFKPDEMPEGFGENSSQSCWDLLFVRSADLAAQLAQILPRERLRVATYRVQVTGYVGELGSFGHMGVCQRRLYAVSVVADGG
jgi:hypothetical protein